MIEPGLEYATEDFRQALYKEVKRTLDRIYATHGKGQWKSKLMVNDRIADSIFQQIVTRPDEYSVLATSNLNGDYISDAAAAQVGGLGIAPGANIGDGYAIFEATHGTAPKYADLDVINPGSVMLSGAMLLDFLGWKEAARLIEDSLRLTIEQKKVTYDFHRMMDGATKVKTSEFATYMIENMGARAVHRGSLRLLRRPRPPYIFDGAFMRKKVSIVGSGNVGATAAHWIAAKELADVVLIDIIEGVPQGKGLDLLEAMPIEKRDVSVLGTNDYADTANSDIVVITAGIPRKPGMSRDDLLNTNHKIMKDVVGKVVQHSPNCILIIVSNPLDAMAQAAYKMAGFSRNRVIGMAGVLDSARFRTFIAEELKVSVENVTAFVLGGHGDTMVPLARYSTVAGIPITELMDKATLERLIQRTRDGGAEIVKYLKTGSAFYAPSAATTEMVEAILKDKKKILPCAAYLEGEYGIHGLYVGVPCKLGARGIEDVIEIKLTAEEKAQLEKSAGAVKELVAVIGV